MFKKIIILIFAFVFFSCNIYLLNNSPKNLPDKEGVIELDTSLGFDSSLKVKNLRASEAESKDSITINWSPFLGCSYYCIERACVNSQKKELKDDIVWTVLSSQPTATQYTDKSALDKDTFYAYRVRAYDRDSKQYSEYSNIAYGSILSIPSYIEVQKGKSENSIDITFSQIPGASGYNIYKSLEKIDKADYSKINSDIILQKYSSLMSHFTYTPKEEEKGKVIYFYIEAVSSSGRNTSDKSLIYQGYTKVKGAPPKLENFTASQGDFKDEIIVKFVQDSYLIDEDEEIKYTLFRTSKGSGEVEKAIFYSSQAAEDGSIYYTDTELLYENTSYTYSLVAENSFGKSEASIAQGYLFSSPVDSSLEAVNTKDEFGYRLKISHPIGVETHPFWKYEITEVFENKTSITRIIDTDEYVFYNCVNDVSDSGYSAEIRRVDIRLKCEDVYSNNFVTSSVYSVPNICQNISASENLYKDLFSKKLNDSGLYPIIISFSTQEHFDYAKITRNDGVEFSVADLNDIEDNSIKLGVKYRYKIELFDKLSRSKGESEYSNYGYGAIGFDMYVDMFEQHCLKPWVSAFHDEYRNDSNYNGIYNYVKQAGTGSLGSATVNARIKHSQSSYMYYNAKVNGIGGYVTFKYNDFGECDYMWISGSAQYSMDVNASGTGSITDYTIFNIAGWYPGSIDFSLLSVKSQAFSGVYKVKINYSGYGEKSANVAPKN